MAFQKGQSGNPSGRKKESWLAEKEKVAEARKAWKKLLDIRDGMVLERKTINTPQGPVELDVVASIKDLILCCREIMDRAIGKPGLNVDLTSKSKAIPTVIYQHPPLEDEG